MVYDAGCSSARGGGGFLQKVSTRVRTIQLNLRPTRGLVLQDERQAALHQAEVLQHALGALRTCAVLHQVPRELAQVQPPVGVEAHGRHRHVGRGPGEGAQLEGVRVQGRVQEEVGAGVGGQEVVQDGGHA